MTKIRYVVLERSLTSDGIEVAGIWYQSPDLQDLLGNAEEILTSIRLDPMDVTRIQVRDIGSGTWMFAPFEKFERLASEWEIDEIVRDFYAVAHRSIDYTAHGMGGVHFDDFARLGWQFENRPPDHGWHALPLAQYRDAH